jgi:hypothetical protein
MAKLYQYFVNQPPIAVENIEVSGKIVANSYEISNVYLYDYNLTNFNFSGDANVYVGLGSNVGSNFEITGISTSTFAIDQNVKIFGVSPSTDAELVPPPVLSSLSAIKVGTESPVNTYRYWVSQYHFRKGKIGVSSQISPTDGISHVSLDNFNDTDHIVLNLARTDTNHGLLIFRQESVGSGSANINNAKLIAILGPRELSFETSGIVWRDYGTYDQTEWSVKGTKNEYVDQIHFPGIANTTRYRGWDISTITSIGNNSITVAGNYNTNIGIGTTNQVKVVHDNTYALKSAIDSAIGSNLNYINLPSGTFLTNKLLLPSEFTLKGNGKNTIIKAQYFATDEFDGNGNQLSFDGNVVGLGTTTGKDLTIMDLTIDGNNGNNIMFDGELDNYIMYFPELNSSLFKGIEIRNPSANGLYLYNSSRVSVESSTFVDSSLTDRYSDTPLNVQESDTLRVNDCLFENFSGPVDFSVTTVASIGGNIIRNCGTGLRVYATGKITTTNNIILGPSDEFIPSPDIYDSDYNSINIAIDRGVDFYGPVLQYIEDGLPKDISSSAVTIISAGIGTIINEGTSFETLGDRFLNFNITTPDSGSFGRENGYIQLSLTPVQTVTLGLTSSLGYNIIAKEFLTQPVGFSTYVGIGTGEFNLIGSGATTYTVTLSDSNQFSGISTGDVVKLINHSVTPDLSSYELTVSEKKNVSTFVKQLVLTGFTETSVTNGSETGYISIRRIFTIAKGRVGVL